MSVDGGKEYIRRLGNPSYIEDLTIYDTTFFFRIRRKFRIAKENY